MLKGGRATVQRALVDDLSRLSRRGRADLTRRKL
jgi:hypothetical protein